MKYVERFASDLSSRRAQHLVYLLHVWACIPFMVLWVMDPHTGRYISAEPLMHLRWLVGLTLAYLALRTWIAYLDPPQLKWWFIFPPVDVGLITALLVVTELGPMSNLTLLYFLPIVQASGTLSVRWTAFVGLLVVVGTTISTIFADPNLVQVPLKVGELLRNDPLNVGFRVVYMLVISSLMAYQALIAASYRERLGVAADRNRIAMEMHDGVQGHLINIASQLELISKIGEKDGKRAVEVANEGRESARHAADELRFLVQRLRAPTLESGFVAALRQYAHNICERNKHRLVFEVTGDEHGLSPEVENALFRIAQEALTNVVKHASASSVAIFVEFSEGKAKIRIEDDGCGFDDRQETTGIGLENLRKRTNDIGGELCVASKTGMGTKVEVSFPIEGANV